MKVKNSIVSIILCFLLFSCASLKVNKDNVSDFFTQWHTESKEIMTKNKANGELQKSINEVLRLHLCRERKAKFKKRFPRLKYQILRETIKVSMYKKLGRNEEGLIFSNIDFKYNVDCDNLKVLIFTPKYKPLLTKKRPYGFADQTQKHNDTALAMLTKMGDNIPYDTSARIYIYFNQELDKAKLFTRWEGSFGNAYFYEFHKENEVWKADGIDFGIEIP